MTQPNEPKPKRIPYEVPVLKKVKLMAQDAVLASCKSSLDPNCFGPGTGGGVLVGKNNCPGWHPRS